MVMLILYVCPLLRVNETNIVFYTGFVVVDPPPGHSDSATPAERLLAVG